MKRSFLLFVALVPAGCGTDVSGPSASLLPCLFGDPLRPAVGQAIQVRGAEHQSVCLEADGSARYVYVPFYALADSSSRLEVGLTGAGLSARTGVETVGVGPGAAVGSRWPQWTLDHEFHARLRAREIAELEPKIRPGAPASARSRAAADVPTVGEVRDFNVAVSCTETDLRTGQVVHVSDHAVIYADTDNPASFTDADFTFFGSRFDDLVYPVETGHFGVPTDIDDNGRAILFFTRAVNERNPLGSQAVTIGFFWSGDLFPAEGTSRLEACPESNHGEMFYLIAPDPAGEAGVPFTAEDIRSLAVPLIGHEFQHLINASRRLFVNQASAFEVGWLNEGLSHVAEELLYFAVTGLEPGNNLTADSISSATGPAPADSLFNRFMGNNINNFARFASRPDTGSVMGAANSLATRGAAWSFLRYAADRSAVGDSAFFHDVVNGTTAGVRNLDAVLGEGVAFDWMRDWSVALYADDLELGGSLLPVEDRFRIPSWNLRSIYASTNLGIYPLGVEPLDDGGTLSLQLQAGGIAFARFGLGSDGRGTVVIRANGGSPPRSLRGSYLRVR